VAEGLCSRRGGTMKRTAIVALCLFALLLAAAAVVAWRDTNLPRLTEVRIPVPGIHREYRLLQVSDLHSMRFGPKQERLRALVAGRRYDAVVLTGDMLDRETEDTEPEAELLEVVGGTSDLIVGVDTDIYSRAVGVPDLQKTGPVRVGEIDLASLSNPGYPQLPEPDDGAVAVVALGHAPLDDARLAEIRAMEPRLIALVAGHYHGGQICLPFLGALAVPQGHHGEERVWLPETEGVQVRGLQLRERVWVSLSNGLGTQQRTRFGVLTRFRFLAPAEMTEIVLVPSR
jgi:predicted MPP superfamily phosphohydrolase